MIDEKEFIESNYFKRRKFRDTKRIMEPEYPLVDFDVNTIKTEAELEKEKEQKEEKKSKKNEIDAEQEEKDEKDNSTEEHKADAK